MTMSFKSMKFLLNTKKIQYLLLLILLSFGLLVRLYKVNNPIADWHSFRQADTASVSKVFYEDGINLLIPRYHDVSSIQSGYFNPKGYRMVEFPLFNALHSVLADIGFASFDATGRMVSVFLSLISATLLFFIGKKYLGVWGGLLTTFFFLFIPYNIYFSRVILPEPLATTLALTSLLVFIKSLEKEKSLLLYLSAAVLSLSMLIKPFTFFYLIPMFYLVFDKYKTRLLKDFSILVKYLLFLTIILVPFFAWRVWINQFAAGIPFFEWAFNGDKIRFRPAFFRWIFIERLGKMILGVWGIGLFIVGIASSKGKSMFNIYFLLGALIYVSLVATANVKHDYYQILIIPSICLLLAKGTLHLWQDENLNKVLGKIVVVLSIALMLGSGAYQIKEFYKINHPEIITAGKAVKNIAAKDDWIIAPYNGDTAFLYQTGRWGWAAVDNSIEKIIERGAKYYVSVNKYDQDTLYVKARYITVEETDEYIIVDLRQAK